MIQCILKFHLKLSLNKREIGKVEHDILLSLADHIYFAIKRIKEKDFPSNPFNMDIQLMFPDEYSVALKAKDVIENIRMKKLIQMKLLLSLAYSLGYIGK